MKAFHRFTIVLLLLGIGVGLAVVIVSDYRSQAAGEASYRVDAQRAAEALAGLATRQRHAELAVEWQTIAGDGFVLKTGLLWRNRPLGNNRQDVRFPIRRFTIPGDEVFVDGVVMRFEKNPIRDATFLDHATLCLFGHLYGRGQEPDHDNALMPRGSVPPDLRSDPARVSPYELQVWDEIWRLRNDPPAAGLRGVTVQPLSPGVARVERGKLYEVWIGDTLGVEIQERDAPTTLADMLSDLKQQDNPGHGPADTERR